eukprot:TRINITY_DN55691_c0_g1_i1.p1 TRINITY_DN55691_c0_g1~~TRINITY_DN55691_c0_g1_i1.p1  ORF type:complete len:390 (+),score=98.81 TRINITY_DN55691_c0_g1_i1:78-1172(+)
MSADCRVCLGGGWCDTAATPSGVAAPSAASNRGAGGVTCRPRRPAEQPQPAGPPPPPGPPDLRLIEPCRCSGTLRWAHERCLAGWVQRLADTGRALQCEVCGCPYRLRSNARGVMCSTSPAAIGFRRFILQHVLAYPIYFACVAFHPQPLGDPRADTPSVYPLQGLKDALLLVGLLAAGVALGRLAFVEGRAVVQQRDIGASCLQATPYVIHSNVCIQGLIALALRAVYGDESGDKHPAVMLPHHYSGDRWHGFSPMDLLHYAFAAVVVAAPMLHFVLTRHAGLLQVVAQTLMAALLSTSVLQWILRDPRTVSHLRMAALGGALLPLLTLVNVTALAVDARNHPNDHGCAVHAVLPRRIEARAP